MNSKTKTILFLSVFVLFISGAGVLYNYLSDKQIKPEIQPPLSNTQLEKIKASDFKVIDENNNEVLLSSKFGKPIVVNFWASWCGPCKSEMPDFNELYKELGSDVEFMMVNLTDNKRETVKKAFEYIEKENFEFPVYFDTKSDAAITYGVSSVPSTLFIDSEGYIVSAIMGKMTKEQIIGQIEKIK